MRYGPRTRLETQEVGCLRDDRESWMEEKQRRRWRNVERRIPSYGEAKGRRPIDLHKVEEPFREVPGPESHTGRGRPLAARMAGLFELAKKVFDLKLMKKADCERQITFPQNIPGSDASARMDQQGEKESSIKIGNHGIPSGSDFPVFSSNSLGAAGKQNRASSSAECDSW